MRLPRPARRPLLLIALLLAPLLAFAADFPHQVSDLPVDPRDLGRTYESVAADFGITRTAVERRVKVVAMRLCREVGIEGMNEAEGVALLDERKAHATQAKYLHTVDYKVGDVIVWDNAQLLHAAPLPEHDQARTLWRITVKEAPSVALA